MFTTADVLARMTAELERAKRIIAAAQAVGLDASDEQAEVDWLTDTLTAV